MLSIGELARRTGVSVRMLRHYDTVGLVVPERVDPATGYRWYTPSQVGRVNSLVALKELGFTLDQCRALLDDRVSAGRLRGMLRLRQAELERRVQRDRRRLAEVERRLRAIEEGLTMVTGTLHLRPLPALRLAQVSGEVNDTSEIGAMVSALSETLAARLSAAGTPLVGRGVRTYHGRPDGSKIDVAVGIPLPPGADPVAGLELAEVPAENRGAVVTHHRAAGDTLDPWLTVDVVLEERGLESWGVYRQVHMEGAADGLQVFELQCPVRELPGRAREPLGDTHVRPPDTEVKYENQ
ncbi:DNA-binding transcriptional MerR regulator [Actinomadura pelletieri DSM 43383]|uniref:DNA-binding transcriptional MerR regulator n=1 Tax=Actinomadura pelletieri DSM 43383 TaxID=1120940 RepID=A0A495QRX9_9ACTN|nr:MerR family transcriptional regulator [Actinomadura pelletieri]RKS76260.1 DNA-binding transcriptional MerR regulator [Actinomadura pelletieri DSM 43383]